VETPWGFKSPRPHMTDRADRIVGVLLGQAAGDALGAGYETGKPVPASGAEMCGGGFGFEPGEWTDDTQQAIVVAQARSDPAAAAAGLMRWYRGGPVDVGTATAAVLGRASRPQELAGLSRAYSESQAAAPRPAHWDPGGANGSLMRTGPACLPFLGDRQRIAAAAREISDLTHADPYCGDACVLWSLAIEAAIERGGEPAELVALGLPYLPAERREFWREQIGRALAGDPAQFSMNGSAVGCFRAALSAVAHADGLQDGLRRAVAIGGDTDTVAAVAGALLGAIHGASAVPAGWREILHGWPDMKAADLERLALEAAT
jgi:ADP-ribosyl-[dinitrogen reductase] hydrolase